MGADVLTTQGGRASATMILICSCIAGQQYFELPISLGNSVHQCGSQILPRLSRLCDYVVCVRQTNYRVSSWCLISFNARFPPLMYSWSQHVNDVYRSQTLRENPYRGSQDFQTCRLKQWYIMLTWLMWYPRGMKMSTTNIWIYYQMLWIHVQSKYRHFCAVLNSFDQYKSRLTGLHYNDVIMRTMA